MSEDVKTRADFGPDIPPPPSLPPTAKTAREISRGVKEIGIPVLLLIGALYKIPHADEAFIVGCMVSLLGHWILRKAEGMPNWETVIAAMLKR